MLNMRMGPAAAGRSSGQRLPFRIRRRAWLPSWRSVNLTGHTDECVSCKSHPLAVIPAAFGSDK